MKSKNREDYLRIIFCLNENGVDKIKSIDIAKSLNISKPAVSEMLKKLKNDGYLEMNPYSSVILTNKGLEESKKITYKHRVIELFLKDILGFDDSEIHDEAHKLEHSMSDEVAKRIFKFLKNPELCPCGHKIPNIN